MIPRGGSVVATPIRLDAIPSGESGLFAVIRCDNGPEFTSRHFLVRCEEQGIPLLDIQPGKTVMWRASYGRFRDECLNHHWFRTLADAKEKIESKRTPHSPWIAHFSSTQKTAARCGGLK